MANPTTPINTSQYCRSARKPAVKGFFGDSGKDVVHPPKGDHAGKAQNPDVRMSDNPVVEVGHALDNGKRHHGALNTDEKIHHRSRKDELSGNIGMNFTEFSPGRVPDVDQKHHDRNHHGDAVDDRDHFQPGRHRHLKQVMGADVRIDNQQSPEAQKAERVAVQRDCASPWESRSRQPTATAGSAGARRCCARKTRAESHPDMPDSAPVLGSQTTFPMK